MQSTAWLLLHHLAVASPSFYNFLYKINHSISDHLPPAPEDAWEEWHDWHFECDLLWWACMTQARYQYYHSTTTSTANNLDSKHKGNQNWLWKSVSPVKVSLLIPYKELVDPQKGPALVNKVGLESEKAEHSYHCIMTNDTSSTAIQFNNNNGKSNHYLQCVWQYHVFGPWPEKKHTGKLYKPKFMLKQHECMHQMLLDLQQELSHRTVLYSWLHWYQQIMKH